MAENLNYATGSGSWCYGDKPDSCKKYGRLYDWNTAMSVCPSGWHLPTREDWNPLVKTAVGWETAGAKLKSTSGWYDWDGNNSGNGTDDYGFSALPGGSRNSDGSFITVGYNGDWWTATEVSVGYAYSRDMDDGVDYLGEYGYGKEYGFSVRCVQNIKIGKAAGDDDDKIEMAFVKGGNVYDGLYE